MTKPSPKPATTTPSDVEPEPSATPPATDTATPPRETMQHDTPQIGDDDSPIDEDGDAGHDDPLPPEPAKPPRRSRVYAAVRINDFCLHALAPVDLDEPDGEVDWMPIGGATILSTDREQMFQLAKANKGLLMATTGLPGGKAMVGLQARADRLAVADQSAARPSTYGRSTLGRTSYKPPVDLDDDGVPF